MDPERLVLELMSAIEGAGLELREIRTAAEPGLRSGLVILRGQPVLFLDPDLPAADRVEIIASALRGRDLSDVYLSPLARSMIEGGELKHVS